MCKLKLVAQINSKKSNNNLTTILHKPVTKTDGKQAKIPIASKLAIIILTFTTLYKQLAKILVARITSKLTNLT